MIKWLCEVVSERQTGWITEWRYNSSFEWRNDRITEWRLDWMVEWLHNGVTKPPNDLINEHADVFDRLGD